MVRENTIYFMNKYCSSLSPKSKHPGTTPTEPIITKINYIEFRNFHAFKVIRIYLMNYIIKSIASTT